MIRFLNWIVSIVIMVVFAWGVVFAGPLSPMAQLGKIMYQDKDFSFNGTQSCMTCHHHKSGFADPDNAWDPVNSVVSTGADGVSQGGRNAPSAAYAGYSSVLHWDDAANGYVGGMFWDGRATGLILGDPLAEQAMGPPLNPVEMNMPDEAAVVAVVRNSTYANLFKQVFGLGALDDVVVAYQDVGHAIASYERSGQVQKFSSRFDRNQLTAQEKRGQFVFETSCAGCHATVSTQGSPAALFTTYGYANIGLPVNPLLEGNAADLGLGGFLEQDFNSASPLLADGDYASQYGKFKIPTLRNVGSTAPYGHNGVFPTLREMVEFINSRDVGDWPSPETSLNLNVEDTGDLGLTTEEIDDIVAFLMSLSDAPGMRP